MMLRGSTSIIRVLASRVPVCRNFALLPCRQVNQRGDDRSGLENKESFANVSEFFKKAETEIRTASEQKAQSAKSATTSIGSKSVACFEELLRNSALMQLGDVNGRHVVGTVFDIIGDDLYVDFGMKFHCVVKRPKYAKRQ